MAESRHLMLEIPDTEKFIRANDLKEVTNPVFFVRDNMPTPDGLLSNEIFGISKEDRANIFAYIDLSEWFIHPLCYKIMCKMNTNIKNCVHGINTYIINAKGELEENENGSNGIAFLKKNWDSIKFKKTDSKERLMNIEFLEKNRDRIFMRKFIIIPAFYRDVNTSNGYTGVGEINKLYSALMVSVRALKESSDYGLSLASSTRARVQEIMLQIYNWFGMGTTIDGQATPAMLPSKNGLISRAGKRKTTDYGVRAVISAPNLRVERLEDMPVTLDYTAEPLSAICTNFYPFILFYLRQFFDMEFGGDGLYPYRDPKTNTIKYVHVDDYRIEFSDERLQKEIDRFIHGYSNRFIPIKVPNKEGLDINMRFSGINVTPEEYAKNKDHIGEMPILDRPLTWCDVLYMAACEAVKEKTVLITRFPIDTMYNQFPTMITVSSTIQTEPMVINNTVYKRYPKIRKEDIGIDTSNKFVDTIVMCNAFLEGCGGDYDGDQVSSKGVFLEESNQELRKHMNSKIQYINLGAENIRVVGKECKQSLYSLSLCLPDDMDKMSSPTF